MSGVLTPEEERALDAALGGAFDDVGDSDGGADEDAADSGSGDSDDAESDSDDSGGAAGDEGGSDDFGEAESDADEDELTPADMAAIAAFVGGDEDDASAASDSSDALAAAARAFLGTKAKKKKPAKAPKAAEPAEEEEPAEADAGPSDKQAKKLRRRRKQRERLKARRAEARAGSSSLPPTLYVRAFHGDLRKRDLAALVEAKLGAAAQIRLAGEKAGAATAFVELAPGSDAAAAAQTLNKLWAGGVQLTVKPALDKAGLATVVKGKAKKEPAAGKRKREVPDKKAKVKGSRRDTRKKGKK